MIVALLVVLSQTAGVATAQTPEPLPVPSADCALFFDQQPIAVEGRVLVPLDAVERWLNTQASRQDDTVTIAVSGEGAGHVEMRLTFGQDTAALNGGEVALSVAPRLVGDMPYLPLLFIAEAVGAWVEPVGHRVHLQKPDSGWECWLAIPPHPQSLEGKMASLALAQKPTGLKRVELVELAADTNSGAVVIARPPASDEEPPTRQRLEFTRDRAGWHLARVLEVEPEAAGE